MKILIAFYYLNNPGGIINNQEGLVQGLTELGHDVVTKCLVWKSSIKVARSNRSNEQERGVMGVSFDQELGWAWPAHMRFAYKGKWNIKRWQDFASGFDLIIWQIPVPTKQKGNRGNTDWPELYKVSVPQIIYTHDGNIRDYPWIYLIKDHLVGAIGVHPCAYHGLKDFPVPRAMAFSAQMNIEERIAEADRSRDREGWLSLQTFKGWKKVDDLVRAVPHMTNTESKILAGGGIHMYYMTSRTKMKDEYVCQKERDPDMPRKWDGKPIWDIAVKAGMDYRGYITNAQRDECLRSRKYLIDPSWSRKYAGVGDHFNRTSIEALIAGAVPIARNFGVSTNEEGIGEFFKPNWNYFMIPYDATPKQFAEGVDLALDLRKSRRQEMLDAGREMLRFWDSRYVAQTFIDLAAQKPAGVYGELKGRNLMGEYCPEMVTDAEDTWKEFFCGQEEESEEAA